MHGMIETGEGIALAGRQVTANIALASTSAVVTSH